MKHDVWVAIAVLTVVCFAIKAAGPVALGGRDLPQWADQLIALVPAALLPALIVVETFAHGKELVLDARAAGGAARRGRGHRRGAGAGLSPVTWLSP